MFEKRVVLITGSSRGIGAATARLFAKQGAAVAVNYRTNASAAQSVVAHITDAGGRAIAVQADVRVAAEVEAMVQTVDKQLGPIDTLVLTPTSQSRSAYLSRRAGTSSPRKSWVNYRRHFTACRRSCRGC